MRIDKNRILLSLLILLCFISLTLAIKITRDILENKKISTYERSEMDKNSSLNKEYRFKLEEYKLTYNGKSLSEKALFTNNKLLLPIDYLLKKNNIRYKFIDSDDVLLFYKDEKEYKVSIGNDTFVLPQGKKSDLLSLFKDGHIYCEKELIKNIGDFCIRKYNDSKNLFLYNNKAIGSISKNINIIKHTEQGNEIINLSELQKSSPNNEYKDGKLAFSERYNKYFFIGENYVFDISQKEKYNTITKLHLTEDGKNFYYLDKNSEELVFLDIKCSETHRIKNVTSIINLQEQDKVRIYAFLGDGKQKKVIFKNGKSEMNSAIIEKPKGEIKYVSNIEFNPEKSKMIYLDVDELHVSDLNGGTDININNETNGASWLTNDRILYIVEKEKFIYTISTDTKESVYNDLKYLGKSSGGTYYKSDNSIMMVTDGKVKELLNTQINIKKIIPFEKDNGLIIIPDSSNDSIYQYYKGDLRRIDIKFKALVTDESFSNFLKLSPDENRIIILESEGRFATLDILDLNNNDKNIKISVDFLDSELDELKLEWLDADNFICYSDNKIFIINATGDDKIFTWSEENTKIEGVIIK